jgi:hypothetical protein
MIKSIPHAACVTLQDGCDSSAVTTLVEEEVKALGDSATTPTAQLTAVLHDALAPAGGDGVNPIQPELIGEAFLLRELDGRTVVNQAKILERAFRRVGSGVIGAVVRTVQDYAFDPTHPSVFWLRHLARLTEDPFVLMAIGDELPRRTLAMCELAAEVQGRIAAALTVRAADDPDLVPLLAISQDELAERLSDLGEWEAALVAAREAVKLHRGLAAQRPDVFWPSLAMSLTNLANILSELDERKAAQAVAREAVELHCGIVEEGPDAVRPDLAALRGAALVVAREAVDLHRALAAQRPDEFRPVLAESLNNLANLLAELGQSEAALAEARQAVDLYSTLVAQRPDAFQHVLATSLRFRARCFDAIGGRERR